MKTNVILKAVVIVAVVMASVMNFSASASNPTNYVKNEEVTNGLITAKTIFRNEDGYLFRQIQYQILFRLMHLLIQKHSLQSVSGIL